MKRIYRLTLLPLSAALLAMGMGGCASIQSTRSDQAALTRQAAGAWRQASSVSNPAVQVEKGAWLMGQEISASRPQPAILDKQVFFHYDVSGWDLHDYASWIQQNVGVNVDIDPSALQASAGAHMGGNLGAIPIPKSLSSALGPHGMSMPGVPSFGAASGGQPIPSIPQLAPMGSPSISNVMEYSGKLSGFLDRITVKKGLYWNYRNGRISIFRTETKTWELPSLPGKSSESGSISSGGGSSGSSGGGGSTDSTLSGGGGSSSSGSSGGGAGSTSMQTSAKIDFWSSLQKTAQAVAGNGVQVVVDESFGTLTATGTPPELEKLGDWVHGLDAQMAKQVAIDVHVYNVQIDKEDNYGLNLGLAYTSANGHTGVSFSSASIPNILGSSSPMNFGASIVGGTLNGTKVAVQALSTLGNVSQVVSRSGVTLNGHLLAMQSARVQHYLASSQTTLSSTAGSSTTLQPGSVTVGFTGNFLPRVVHGKILMDLNMTLSDLLGINSISSNGSTIQLPNVQSATFEQNVSLKPGQTLVLTGYRQHTAGVTNNGIGSPYFSALGGGVDAQKGDTILAVVITARIL